MVVILILITITGTVFADSIGKTHKYYNEIPLINCDGIVVDSDENIYLRNGLFGQVQVYNRHGEYKHSIKPNTTGHFTLNVDENDNLYVAMVRSRIVRVFDNNGFVIEEIPDSDISIYRSYNHNKNEFRAQDGALYKIMRFYGYITVAKSVNGNNEKVFGMPVFHWLTKAVIMIVFIGTPVVANIIVWAYRLGKKNRKIRKNAFKFKDYRLSLKSKQRNLDSFPTTYLELNRVRNELFHRFITFGVLIVLSTMYISYLSWVSYQIIGFETFAGFIFIFVIFLLLNKLILIIRYLCSHFVETNTN